MSDNYKTMGERALMHGPLEALFCCIGDPVIGNPTQIMVEDAFEEIGFAGRYLTCTVATGSVKEAIEGIKALGFAGANVTAPHKVEVIQYLDGLTESARLSGAVNCIYREGDKLIGDNTDGKGFHTSIDLIKPVEGMKVLVLGAVEQLGQLLPNWPPQSWFHYHCQPHFGESASDCRYLLKKFLQN